MCWYRTELELYEVSLWPEIDDTDYLKYKCSFKDDPLVIRTLGAIMNENSANILTDILLMSWKYYMYNVLVRYLENNNSLDTLTREGLKYRSESITRIYNQDRCRLEYFATVNFSEMKILRKNSNIRPILKNRNLPLFRILDREFREYSTNISITESEMLEFSQIMLKKYSKSGQAEKHHMYIAAFLIQPILHKIPKNNSFDDNLKFLVTLYSSFLTNLSQKVLEEMVNWCNTVYPPL